MLSDLRAPGIYIREEPGPRPIQAVGTSTAGFVGVAPAAKAHLDEVIPINNWTQFVREFVPDEGAASTPLSQAVHGFFLNGGSRLFVVNVGRDGAIAGGRGRSPLDLLAQIDEIAIVAAPGYTDAVTYDAVISHCEQAGDRVAILDAPGNVRDVTLLTDVATVEADAADGEEAEEGAADAGGDREGLRPRSSSYGALYFPWITVFDPLSSEIVDVAPSGHIAGIWARSDAARGVHKAPANEIVRGALNVTYHLTRAEQGDLNQSGINCIRFFTDEGILVWGARTLDSDGEWRYLNVRRLFNMIKESIANSTRWIVFEPNDRPLWKAIQRDVGAFLTGLWREGALMGRTADEAFFVKCDEETNPQDQIDRGVVTTWIGIAPVKPAEFVVFRISQVESGAEIELRGG